MASQQPFSLAICIPTYKRPQLLRLLLADLAQQTLHPDTLIIVDGDPASGEVRQILSEIRFPAQWLVLYVPSNHSNLPYQRYLGWRKAKEENHTYFIYFDDDIRLPQHVALEKLITPFEKSPGVVGVTAATKSSQHPADSLNAPRSGLSRFLSLSVARFGSAKNTSPGGLSPSGHRLAPVPTQEAYQVVKWLYGRVMAYRMTALTQDRFSENLFAMYERRLGKAEDTVLSYQVSFRGEMNIAREVDLLHPDDETPRAYPSRPFYFAQSLAYSRRLINDLYRNGKQPVFSDRLHLIKSYAGNIVMSWLKVLTSFSTKELAQASGYMAGAVRGLFQPPTAHRLTPHIDWWQAADQALTNVIIIQQAVAVSAED